MFNLQTAPQPSKSATSQRTNAQITCPKGTVQSQIVTQYVTFYVGDYAMSLAYILSFNHYSSINVIPLFTGSKPKRTNYSQDRVLMYWICWTVQNSKLTIQAREHQERSGSSQINYREVLSTYPHPSVHGWESTWNLSGRVGKCSTAKLHSYPKRKIYSATLAIWEFQGHILRFFKKKKKRWKSFLCI